MKLSLLAIGLVLLPSCWYKDLVLHERYAKDRLHPTGARLDGYYYRAEAPRLISEADRHYSWPGAIRIYFFYGDGTLFGTGMSYSASMDTIDERMRTHFGTEKGLRQIKAYVTGHGFYDVVGDSVLLDFYGDAANGIPHRSWIAGTLDGDSAIVLRTRPTARGAGSQDSAWATEERYHFRKMDWQPDSIGALQLSPAFVRKDRKYM